MNDITDTIRPAALRKLWERMIAIYGFRWASAYGEAAEIDGKLTLAADTWQRGLAGLPERAIGAGLDACLAAAEPWPPTLPQFRALCLRIPTLHAVRAELRSTPEVPSPFLRQVMSGIDLHRFRLATADAADRMLRDAYDAAREHVMRGGSLPTPPAALIEKAEPRRTPARDETVRANLDAMRDALRVAEVEPVDDPSAPASTEHRLEERA